MNDEQYTKLFEYIEESRNDSNEKFDKIDQQFDLITKTVVKGFERIDKALENKVDKQDISRIYDLLDKISKDQSISDDERLVMGHQLNRLDSWVHELADKIGHKLPV